MTIETRTVAPATYQTSQPHRRDSNSSTGYQDSPSEDDGYFTSAVSVQHKTSNVQQSSKMEASSSSNCSTMENVKKVVWPNIQPGRDHHAQDHVNILHHHHHTDGTFSNGKSNVSTDKPMGWMKNVSNEQHHAATEAIEMEIQKRVWDATTGRRLSRSRSRSKNIMERARSFERVAAEAAIGGGSAGSSRAPSRQGSSSNIPNQLRGRRNKRSPSVGRQMAEFWQGEVQNLSRPSSRAGGRERSVGRVDVSQWEAAASKAKENSVPPKTPPPKRREMKPPTSNLAPRNNAGDLEESAEGFRSPSPPVPPPPPRNMSSRSKTDDSNNNTNAELSEATIQSLSQEEKEQIVEQWVRQTSTQEARDELEQFAYEIAESVVNTMERNQPPQQHQQPPSHHLHHQQRQKSQPEPASASSSSTTTMKASCRKTTSNSSMTIQENRSEQSNTQVLKSSFSGKVNATPAEVHVSNAKDKFADEKRRLSEYQDRKAKEQEHQRLLQLEQDRLRMQKIQEQQVQEQQRQQQQQMEQQRLQQQKQQEIEQQQQRLLQQQKQQDMEQQRLMQEQLEEQQRFQQEQQQQAEERRRKEEQDLLEQQQQQQIHQRFEETKQLRRSQTPSLTRRAIFEPINQASGFKKVDSHFGQVKTGHVSEKRSFWMRSISTDKLNHEMSPGPRRRRVTGGQDWIKQSDQQDQGYRPGSSLAQVIGGQTGDTSAQNVKTVVSGWSDLSKSKSSAAVLQEREKRPRRSQSRERMREFIPVTAAQNQSVEQPIRPVLSEAHTNQVQETVSHWGHPHPSEEVRTTTPIPTRNIGDTFADSKMNMNTISAGMQQHQQESSSSPWRTKNPEPTVKVINVAVENTTNNNNNIHISENAASQMASFVQQQQQETKTSSSMISSSSSMTASSTTNVMQNSSNVNVSDDKCFAQVPPKSPGPSSRKFPSSSSTSSAAAPKGKSVNSRPLPPTPTPPPTSSTPPSTSLENSKTEPMICSTSSCSIPMSIMATSATAEATAATSSSTSLLSSSTISSSCTSSSWTMKQENTKRNIEQRQQQKQQKTETFGSSSMQTNNTNQNNKQDFSILNEWLAGEEKQLEESIKNLENSSPKPSNIGTTTKSRNNLLPATNSTINDHKILSIAADDNCNEILQSINPNIISSQTPTNTSSTTTSTTPTPNELNLKGKVKEGLAMFKNAERSSKLDHHQKFIPAAGEKLEGSHEKAKQALLQHNDKEMQIRIELEKNQRAKELEDIKKQQTEENTNELKNTNSTPRAEITSSLEVASENATMQPSMEVLEARSRMLQEVASRRELTPTTSATSDDDNEFTTSQEKAAERAKKERNKELAEIAEMRGRTNWQEVVTSSSDQNGRSRATPTPRTPDPDLEEAKTTIRNAAARWQEREQSSKPRFGTPPSGRNTPSRRIGNLFNRDSDHWKMEATGGGGDAGAVEDTEEDFPAPPTDIEMQVSTTITTAPATPPPPPRDSSKEVMMEYSSVNIAGKMGKK